MNDRSVGRWALALIAVLMAAGYLGSVGSAHAGDEPDGNGGSSNRDGQSVSCYADWPPRHNTPATCNAVGAHGEDGAPGAVHR